MEEVTIGETRILYPGKLKWGLVSLIGLSFALGGVFMIRDGQGGMAWFVTIFFGLTAVVGLLQLFGKGSSLTLTREGFQIRNMGRDMKLVRWQECSGFGVASVGAAKMIVYDHLHDRDKALGQVNQSLVGGSSALPDTYGMKPQELADLMNAYREKSFYNDPN